MAENKQQLMYNDAEIQLIKEIFAENDFLLKAIRKVLFGADTTSDEKKALKDVFSREEVKEVFRKKVYGLNNMETPIGQLSDFWLGAESQVFGATKDTIKQSIKSKQLVLSMFEQGFELLSNPDGEKIAVSYNPDEDDDLGIGLIARNLYMKAIETALMTVQTIAGQKEETFEATMKRLQQDSAK